MDWLALLSLEQVLKWTGVILALVGAVLSAPHGVRQLGADISSGTHWAFYAAWDFLGRLIPRWRRRIPATVMEPQGIGSVEAFGKTRFSVENWTPEADIETRVNQLKDLIDSLAKEMREGFEDASKAITEHDTELARMEQLWSQTKAEFLKRLEDNDAKAALVDAAGLPVIAAGVFLSGVPAELAAVPVVGWAFWLASVGVLVWCSCKSKRGGAWKG